MADIWVWEIDVIPVDQPATEQIDLTGFEVDATDGKIGTVDEATNEAGRGVLVVDTGFWIFGKKRMIPAGLITGIDPEARKVQLGVTKQQVKEAPDYDELRREEDVYRKDVASHYERFRGDPVSPVAGSGRAPEEMTGDPISPTAGTG